MSTPSDQNEALLESLGWTVECQSPFEIRHQDGSFASGQAARLVLSALQSDADEASSEQSAAPVTELLALFDRVRTLTDVAAQQTSIDHDSWKRCFELVFSASCSRRIGALLDQLGISFDYCDPDCDYEDDVLAYASALKDLQEKITPFLACLPAKS